MGKNEAKAAKELWGQNKHDPEAFYGSEVFKGPFGLKHFTFYSKGFVSVNKQPPERLVAVQATINTQKKTGPGRLIAGALTLGMNLALTPNQRGDLYLVVVTDVDSYQVNVSPPSNMFVQQLQKIESVANAILSRSATNSGVTTPVENLPGQLQKLAELRASGLLTEAEYESAKARVINS